MVELSDPSAGDKLEELAAGYDRSYVQANYFQYRTWVYRPFIKAIIKRVRLAEGSRLLDAGCGQGFFTSLFAECGMKALGVDISPEGVRQARKLYGAMPNAEFNVGDVCRLAYTNEFDCVYSRSCSLYNRDNFAEDRSVSDALLKYVKPGGVLIFDYYTNLCPRKKSSAWLYHSVAAARKHFSHYPGGEVYFSLRVDTLLLGSRSFSMSALNIVAGRFTGIGGDLVAIVPKGTSS
jgi:SAM-dependent methyltransferase